ncbi:MAG: translation elongation factor Ts [Phycisphaerales bacterium]
MTVEINAKDVMALRNSTGLPMMECKKALAENNGDREAAEEWLRKKLKGKMDARTDRAAGEGRIAVMVKDNSAAIVELRAETDFTARNENFLKAAESIATDALGQAAGDISVNDAATKAIDNLRISTGENVSFARAHKLEGGAGTKFGSYVHHDGKLGVLVQGEGDVSDDLLKDIAMHIAASPVKPEGVSPDEIPDKIVERERRLALEQAMESGKPKEIAEKMVEGKLRKFFEDVALIEQPFVKDPEKKIKDLVPKGGKIVAFVRWRVGETA